MRANCRKPRHQSGRPPARSPRLQPVPPQFEPGGASHDAGHFASRDRLLRRQPHAAAVGRNSGQRSLRRLGLLDAVHSAGNGNGRSDAGRRHQHFRRQSDERLHRHFQPPVRPAAPVHRLRRRQSRLARRLARTLEALVALSGFRRRAGHSPRTATTLSPRSAAARPTPWPASASSPATCASTITRAGAISLQDQHAGGGA